MGLLSERSIIGHGIFLDDHPSTRWHTDTDVKRLAETGTTVAHCPTVFARRGITLKDFGRYRRAGVNMGVGTDTYPHNMLDEMRLVAYLARTQAGNPRTLNSTDLFEAATIGGARALGRDDIGRLAAGCRADIVVVDLTHPMMRPSHDPVRSLIYAAGDRAVRSVFVDGQKVVEDGRVLTIDYPAAAAALHEAQKRVKANVPNLDWDHRTAEQISPPDVPHCMSGAQSQPLSRAVGGRGLRPSPQPSPARGEGALLACLGSPHRVPHPGGDVAAVDGVDISVAAAAPSASSAKVRLRQVGAVAVRDAAGARRPAASPPDRSCSTAGTCSTCRSAQMRDIRGNRIAMIFQEPMTSLNPVFTVGDQITEAMRAHDRTASGGALRGRAIAALQRVRIPAPERRFDEYPHQMSGGMRQRVMIAMALACEPDLLIADEPTTALDVTVQAQILDLLRELQQQTGMAIILITHDLGIVAEMANEVAVMYAGRVVERASGCRDLRRSAASLHARPARQHPEDRRDTRPAAGDRGHRSGPVRPAGRLPFPSALRVRRRRLHRAGSNAAPARRGPSRRLHPRAGRGRLVS